MMTTKNCPISVADTPDSSTINALATAVPENESMLQLVASTSTQAINTVQPHFTYDKTSQLFNYTSDVSMDALEELELLYLLRGTTALSTGDTAGS